jgi:outer membrane protein OmpA-like peptidoglycan-associated protein
MKALCRVCALAGLVALASICHSLAVLADESDCQKAEALYQEASIPGEITQRTALLQQAVRRCPDHAKAWLNLGNLYEKQYKLDAAITAYGKANALDPNLGTPLAGLGDAALKQGRFSAAQRWYKDFLAFLKAEDTRGNPRKLNIYKDEYQEKYERAKLKRDIHLASIDGVVRKDQLMRGLRPIEPGGGLGKETEMERLTLCIHFDFNSAELEQQGREQLAELAMAMLDPTLENQSFLIEGHSDLFGEPDYNLELSSLRARRVRQFLSAEGIDPQRLKTKGVGENKPLITTGDKKAQRVNRRVEFVQLGILN